MRYNFIINSRDFGELPLIKEIVGRYNGWVKTPSGINLNMIAIFPSSVDRDKCFDEMTEEYNFDIEMYVK